jgi:hypothetical protein
MVEGRAGLVIFPIIHVTDCSYSTPCSSVSNHIVLVSAFFFPGLPFSLKMVSFSCCNLFRGLRSMCAPISTVVGFSLILTYIFVLYQPTRGPGIKQRMGWQSWEIVNAPGLMAPSHSGHPSSPSKPDQGVDWWNVTTPDENIDMSSLPLDVWSPLLPHDTGRT